MYVDDLILAGNSSSLIDQTKNFLSSSFHMNYLGALIYFLGIEVNRSAQEIFLSQNEYKLDMIKEFGVNHTRKLRIPMDPMTKLTLNLDDPLPDPVIFHRLVGKLLYLTLTISYSVHILSQLCNVLQLLIYMLLRECSGIS